MTGVDGNGHGSHGGHGLHQSALLTAGDVDEPGVVGRVVVGVVVTRLVILEEEEGEDDEWEAKILIIIECGSY